jgi:hypothetical protein
MPGSDPAGHGVPAQGPFQGVPGSPAEPPPAPGYPTPGYGAPEYGAAGYGAPEYGAPGYGAAGNAATYGGSPAAGVPQPGGYPYGEPPAPPVRKRRTGLIIGSIVGAFLLLCCGGGVAVLLASRGPLARIEAAASPSPTDDPSAPFKKGDCLGASAVANMYKRIACSDKLAIGTVISTLIGSHNQDCGPQADLVVERAGSTACVRSRTSKHDGAAGEGGGSIVPGDCVAVDDPTLAVAPYSEVPCAAGRQYEKVSGRVLAEAQCGPPAIRFVRMPRAGTTPVLCLAPGPGSATAGTCIGARTVLPVPCSSGSADMTVLARRPTEQGCSTAPGTTHWVADPQGLPKSKVLCMKKKGQSL